MPTEYGLDQNQLNPFNPQCEICFALPEAVEVTRVVYDVQGREVARLARGCWRQATTRCGGRPRRCPAASLYRLTVGSFTEARTIMLIR